MGNKINLELIWWDIPIAVLVNTEWCEPACKIDPRIGVIGVQK